MQIQSDYLGTKLIRPKNVETTSQGAAFLAGLGVGIWKSTSEIEKIWSVDKEFAPNMKDKGRKHRLEQ
jgi:glycerol kinase